MKQKRTWVLIADARRARVFESRGKGSGLRAVPDIALDSELPPSCALGTDRPGRTFESVGSARHAMENPSDLHREQKREFAQQIARAVHDRYAAKSFDRLVVVAPAVTMGDLRAALPDHIKAITTAELVADLTKTPIAELPSHLANVEL